MPQCSRFRIEAVDPIDSIVSAMRNLDLRDGHYTRIGDGSVCFANEYGSINLRAEGNFIVVTHIPVGRAAPEQGLRDSLLKLLPDLTQGAFG